MRLPSANSMPAPSFSVEDIPMEEFHGELLHYSRPASLQSHGTSPTETPLRCVLFPDHGCPDQTNMSNKRFPTQLPLLPARGHHALRLPQAGLFLLLCFNHLDCHNLYLEPKYCQRELHWFSPIAIFAPAGQARIG